MTDKEAIKFLQQLYPNGGHCWLDEQRIEAIDMAVKALQEEPVSEDFEKIVEEIAEPTILNAYGTKELARRLRNTMCGTSVSEELEEPANKDYENALNSVAVNFMEAQGITPNLYAEQIIRAVKHGAQWQKQRDNIPSNDLEEETLSEDLETELDKYIKDHFTIDKEQLDRFGLEEKDYMYSMDKSDMLAMVRHFANWQKEQMMEKAVEREVKVDAGGYPYIDATELYDYSNEESLAKAGDKVKVLIIKEED